MVGAFLLQPLLLVIVSELNFEMMSKLNTIFSLVVILSTVGCLQKEILEEVSGGYECDLNGSHMQWTISGNDMCADTFLDADYSGGVMTLNGISGILSTLTLDIEATSVGTHPFNGSSEFVLLTQLGMPWVSSDTLPGSFEINMHDLAHQRIAGTMNVDLLNELTNEVKTLQGDFELDYSN